MKNRDAEFARQKIAEYEEGWEVAICGVLAGILHWPMVRRWLVTALAGGNTNDGNRMEIH